MHLTTAPVAGQHSRAFFWPRNLMIARRESYTPADLNEAALRRTLPRAPSERHGRFETSNKVAGGLEE